ncbi:3-deoxy-D-manno-octulosonic-acid transferase [Delftia tsuruhatensis]|nr:3-deoxy-D-manno-octulosonic-acid transferase [Delftia tsuruhatensis]CAC9683906.1 3-deoxy-D-manno-octulosonic-acid transferase [Delftia tsuruhatensis]
MHWARALYSAVTWAAQPVLRRKLLRRAQAEPVYAEHIPERFGRYAPATLGEDGRGQWVWIHAVSLGETRAAAILLAALRQCLPGMRLLLTHGTATGRAEGMKLLRPGDLQVWQPWDTPGAVRRFLRQFRPAVGVLMETEVWPNLVAVCRQEGIALALANARLSDKSLGQALRVAPLARPTYAALAAAWAQTEDDAARLRQLGAPVRGVLGNLKFDARPDTVQLERARACRQAFVRPVLLLASSREGEEAMLIEALHALGPQARRVQWLVVPRHPQRFDEVAALLAGAGLHVSRRSQWVGGPPAGAAAGDIDVWLGDSLGEMAFYYGLADAALMGGSFAPLGGQNLIEALACDCPVALGPHTFNFSEASELACAAGAALRAPDMDHAIRQAMALAQDPPSHLHAVRQARDFLQEHRGAAQATAQAVVALMRAQEPFLR